MDFYGAKAYGHGSSTYYGVQSGDFDNDGKTDTLIANAQNIFVYYGTGDGEFITPPVLVYNYTGNPILPVIGDFNNDGRSDVALSRKYQSPGSPALVIYFGNANRTFSAPVLSSFAEPADYLTVLDYNMDGKPDIVGNLLNYTSDIVFYKGDGAGSFIIERQIASGRISSIVFGDLNNDSLPDLVFGDWTGLKIMRNLGGGNFAAPESVGNITYGFNSQMVADVNNDGYQDIITVQNSSYSPVIAVWRGNNNFGFSRLADFTYSTRDGIHLNTAADINRDGKADLIFSTINRTIIFKGGGNGSFSSPEVYYDGGTDVYVKDLNADGWDDVVSAESNELNGYSAGILLFC